MHAARYSTSRRLQKVWSYLNQYPGGRTTRQIIRATGVCAVSAIVAELRAGGRQISCTLESVAKDGTRTYRYALGER